MRENTEKRPEEAPEAKSVRVWLPGYQEFRALESKEDHNHDVAQALQSFLLSSMQLQNLLVLAGSGTSLGAGGPSMGDLWTAAQSLPNFDHVRDSVNYSNGKNIEEFLTRCAAHTEIYSDTTIVKFYESAVALILDKCRRFLKPDSALPDHNHFLRKLARRRTRDGRLKLFTTNYDLCFDQAAGQLRLIPVDGFSFGSSRQFDPKFFDYDIVKSSPGSEGHTLVPGVFQYFKLHGSVNWAESASGLVIDPNVDAKSACLIYPAKTKFRSSYKQPHLELMARYLSSLREPNTCLVCIGFGFQDEHLTAPILASIETNPHFRAIIVSPRCEEHFCNGKHEHWRALQRLAPSTDLALIAADFGQFAELIPNLRALTPAEDLVRVVRKVTGVSNG